MLSNYKVLATRAFGEVWNMRNLAVVDQLMGAGFLFHAPGLEDGPAGMQGFKSWLTGLQTALPDFHVTLIGDLIGEGHFVSARWILTGTHLGAYHNIPASGKKIRVEGMSIFRFELNRIAEIWQMEDRLALVQQLGVVAASV